ncbi:hypothetical protein ElyMa_002616700 [Elysia marginata]|uniref:Uncharacterized protein n=1 Tax=Elysia marginata TaxID=1093978 RepID=A0AAV4H2V9_9GAST|nr:hypothetical protein ElyMa_002616700 [Elysia marginata]
MDVFRAVVEEAGRRLDFGDWARSRGQGVLKSVINCCTRLRHPDTQPDRLRTGGHGSLVTSRVQAAVRLADESETMISDFRLIDTFDKYEAIDR